MTEQEKINQNLQRQIDAQNARIDNISVSINGLIRALQDFKEEMRDRDNQRAEDIREIRASLDSMGKHVRNLAWTGMAAVGGMAVAVGAMVVTVIYSVLKS